MARKASSLNDAPVKSESIRTEPRGRVVTNSGTARAIFSTSTAEQFDRVDLQDLLAVMVDEADSFVHIAKPKAITRRQRSAILSLPFFRLSRSRFRRGLRSLAGNGSLLLFRER